MSKKITNNRPPLVLLILDGWGIAKPGPGNAIEQAKKPNFDRLWKNNSHASLEASGKYVGLPDGQAGNSEAGHMNIGAGRIVDQDNVYISKEINSGKFFKNPAFALAYKHILKKKSNLHLMGMLANGQSGHADPDHLWALISWARKNKIPNVYLHIFTDGRDSPPHSALKSIEALMRGLKNKETKTKRTGEWIATVMGRYYAMDRKKNWKNTQIAYNTMVMAKGLSAKSPQAAITQAYNRGETDEFVQPYVIKRQGKPIAKIKDNDAVIFFNLRSDRARQLAKPFVQEDFTKNNKDSFLRQKTLKNINFVALTDFGPDLGSIITAYPAEDIKATLPMVLDGRKQLYIAESEKYAHVTYFFNGGYADPVAEEDRVVIPSPNIPSYDQKPAMSIYKISHKVISQLNKYQFICVNFANADMISHTGNIKATVEAVEHIDKCIGEIYKAVVKKSGHLVITADHSNADMMINPATGEKDTEHNDKPVPLIIYEHNHKTKRKLKNGKLGDIAPTILKISEIKKPKEMTGKALF